MSFLSASFLWALPLVAVPVVIHLFHRRRRDVVRWGAMQFLLAGATRRRRIWRIDDLIMMLLRALAVLVVVLALARPLVTAGWLGGAAHRDVILIIDTSLSTGRTVDDHSEFQSIIGKAGDIVSGLQPGDSLRILLASARPNWLTPVVVEIDQESRHKTLQQLEGLQPTLDEADWLASLLTAIRAEPVENAEARYVIAVTDGSVHGWRSDAVSAWQEVARLVEQSEPACLLNVVDVGRHEVGLENVSLEEIRTIRPLVGIGESFSLTAEVKNHGRSSVSVGNLAWKLDGQPLGISSIPALEPGESATASIEHFLDATGVYEITCEMNAADQLAADNRSTYVTEAVDRVPILIVEHERDRGLSRTNVKYLQAAFGRVEEADDPLRWQSVFEPTVIGVDEMPAINLGDFRCVLLPNVPVLDQEALDRLAEYVHSGGGLWIGMGSRTRVDEFNASLFNEGGGLSPLPIAAAIGDENDQEKFSVVHPPTTEHPATALLGDTQRLDLDDVKIYRHFPFLISQEENRVSVLLESGNGEPLAVEHYLGEGRVIVQGIPFTPGWSNLPLCHVYVAIAHEWLWYLIQPTAASHNLEPGALLVFNQDEETEETAITVQPPFGHSATPRVVSENSRRVYLYNNTYLPGDYLVTVAAAEGEATDQSAPRNVPYRVRRNPEESNLDPLNTEQRERLSQIDGLQFVDDPFAVTVAAKSVVGRKPAWSFLLFVLLFLMAAEILLAQWSARRRFIAASPSTVQEN